MKLSERALKDQLIELANNKFVLPAQADAFQRTLEMMPHIGSPDSELRDDLIYTCLATWILDDPELFTEEQFKELLALALDEEHLFYRLGEQNTDSVFRRSFSMLLLPLILIAHRQRPFLTQAEVRQVKTQVLDYLSREQDLRGYVTADDKGWAHTVAHAADALDDLAQCKELEADDLGDILNGIQGKVAVSEKVYQFEEDERLVIPALACLGRKLLKEPDVKNWLNSFVSLAQETEPFPACYRRAMNVKLFLRSLYFRAQNPATAATIGETSAHALMELTLDVLNEIGRF
ncbi:MAG: DUF2785 domain-containing protein [Chloroflexi bacterium]|nr:DUF2785 domain-containing protein [Chloroflexota bacterium]